MHSPPPPLDDERADFVVLRQVRPARVSQVLGSPPVLRRSQQEAVLRRRDLPDQGRKRWVRSLPVSGGEDEGWGALWSRARSEGWRSRKIGKDWVRGCEHCGVEE
jgi:hypothetical protein